MRAFAFAIALLAAGSAFAGTRRESRLPAPGTYRFVFRYTNPDMPVNRVPKGTYTGTIVVDKSGVVAISTDESGKTIAYRGPLTKFIRWRRGLRLVLLPQSQIALHDDRELLYGCGADEGDNGWPCVEVLERVR
jgi:hypothetical protein